MQEAINKLNKIIDRCKNTDIDQLYDFEVAIKTIIKFATQDNIFGSDENNSIIDLDKIYDEVPCLQCKHINKIYGKDTPLYNSIYSNLCNGITSLRRLLISKSGNNILGDFGIDYDKDKKSTKFYFKGIKEKSTRADIPSNIRAYFNNLIDTIGLYCAECDLILHKRSSKKEWHIDHISSKEMDKYFDKAYAKNPVNYRALCLSCSCKDRQIEIQENKLKKV